MDSRLAWSTGDVAALVGLSAPAVRRAAERLGLVPETTTGGHRRFSRRDVDAIVADVGIVPTVPGLSRHQVQVLTAVARHPLGLDSVRAVSRAAGTSPTAASAALASLDAAGYVEQWHLVAPDAGRARPQTRWRLRVEQPWLAVAGVVSRTVLPTERRGPSPTRVPRRFWHLFWNADPSTLVLPDHADFVATRLILSRDVSARAWALLHLPRTAIEVAAANRAASPSERALIRAVAG